MESKKAIRAGEEKIPPQQYCVANNGARYDDGKRPKEMLEHNAKQRYNVQHLLGADGHRGSTDV